MLGVDARTLDEHGERIPSQLALAVVLGMVSLQRQLGLRRRVIAVVGSVVKAGLLRWFGGATNY